MEELCYCKRIKARIICLWQSSTSDQHTPEDERSTLSHAAHLNKERLMQLGPNPDVPLVYSFTFFCTISLIQGIDMLFRFGVVLVIASCRRNLHKRSLRIQLPFKVLEDSSRPGLPSQKITRPLGRSQIRRAHIHLPTEPETHYLFICKRFRHGTIKVTFLISKSRNFTNDVSPCEFSLLCEVITVFIPQIIIIAWLLLVDGGFYQE